MPQMTIEKMGIRHTAILDYVLLHEGRVTQQEIADHFGLTRVWVSCVMNSDAFKVELARRRGDAELMINLTLADRIQGVAALALERVGEYVQHSSDPDYLLDAADKLLHRAGYAPQRGPAIQVNNNTQNNTYIPVSRDVLAECRQQITEQAARPAALPAPETEDVAFEAVRHLLPVSSTDEI